LISPSIGYGWWFEREREGRWFERYVGRPQWKVAEYGVSKLLGVKVLATRDLSKPPHFRP